MIINLLCVQERKAGAEQKLSRDQLRNLSSTLQKRISSQVSTVPKSSHETTRTLCLAHCSTHQLTSLQQTSHVIKSVSRVPARFSTQGFEGLCAMLQVNFAWTLATSEDLKHPTTDGERSDSWAADAFAAYFQQVLIADTGATNISLQKLSNQLLDDRQGAFIDKRMKLFLRRSHKCIDASDGKQPSTLFSARFGSPPSRTSA